MTKLISILILVVAILSACGSDLSEGDQEACNIYESTVEESQEGTITDDEMLSELEEAWNVAESERLQDLLDDLLIYFEDGEGDLQGTVNSIKVYCSID